MHFDIILDTGSFQASTWYLLQTGSISWVTGSSGTMENWCVYVVLPLPVPLVPGTGSLSY